MERNTALGEWQHLKGKRSTLETRWEKYSGWTIPRLFSPENYKQESEELSHDFQSVGAQGTNHIVNKLMLALFSASRPFIRLELDERERQALIANLQLEDGDIDAALASGERRAVRYMDREGTIRSKLYNVLANLAVLGNVVLYLPPKKASKESVRVFGLKNFVVRRTGTGEVKTCIIREELLFDELASEVQEWFTQQKGAGRYRPDTSVQYFIQIERQPDGTYRTCQWVDKQKLPSKWDGKYTADTLPYRVLTWGLEDSNDYGSGLVEDYSGDFNALSMLSEAEVTGAILASEFRWLVNPAGFTKAEDFEQSDNGAALPGVEGDIQLVANSKPGDLQVVSASAERYIRRLGQAFLLNSAVTRDAERVTAEEIRQQAVELETSLGGTYSRIAVDLQRPLGRWLLERVDFSVSGTKVELTIVTGLDALSRNADLENVRLFVSDIAMIGTLPEPVQRVVKLDNIVATLAVGRNLDPKQYVKNADERAQDDAAQQQQMQDQVATEAGGQIAVAQATQQ
jgi:hypothetical protein